MELHNYTIKIMFRWRIVKKKITPKKNQNSLAIPTPTEQTRIYLFASVLRFSTPRITVYRLISIGIWFHLQFVKQQQRARAVSEKKIRKTLQINLIRFSGIACAQVRTIAHVPKYILYSSSVRQHRTHTHTLSWIHNLTPRYRWRIFDLFQIYIFVVLVCMCVCVCTWIVFLTYGRNINAKIKPSIQRLTCASLIHTLFCICAKTSTFIKCMSFVCTRNKSVCLPALDKL